MYSDPEKQKAAVEKWQEEHQDEMREKKAEWYQRNKEKRRKQNRDWRRNRHAQDASAAVNQMLKNLTSEDDQ